MTTQNPYAPPGVNLVAETDAASLTTESLISDGRRLPAGNGSKWLRAGWQLFKLQPLMWWCVIIISTAWIMMVTILPYVGEVLAMMVTPAVMAGCGICARNALREGSFSISDIFEGFKQHQEAQLWLGVFYTISVVALTGLILFASDELELMSQFYGAEIDPAQSLTFSGINLCAIILVCSSTMFAPYLVREHGVSAWQAVRMSVRGCLRNIGPLLAYSFVLLWTSVLASLPLGLGWLVLLPVMEISAYLAYRDIFIEAEA